MSGQDWLLLFAVWLVASVACRLYLRKPLWASTSPHARFSERWVSARMGSGLVARLGTARNCMHVQVTGTGLAIHPHFPFTLGFMPEIYDLDHVIPLDQVMAATILSDGRAKAVEVRYRLPDGRDNAAQLLIKDAAGFVAAVRAPRRPQVGNGG